LIESLYALRIGGRGLRGGEGWKWRVWAGRGKKKEDIGMDRAPNI